jgi:hypothetical protein
VRDLTKELLGDVFRSQEWNTAGAGKLRRERGLRGCRKDQPGEEVALLLPFAADPPARRLSGNSLRYGYDNPQCALFDKGVCLFGSVDAHRTLVTTGSAARSGRRFVRGQLPSQTEEGVAVMKFLGFYRITGSARVD